MPDKPKPRDKAAEFGFDLAFLKSIPEIWKLAQRAIDNDWDQGRFTAEFRETEWFRTRSATTRAAISGRITDPGTWEQRLNQSRAAVRDMAVALGAQVDEDQITKIAERFLKFGWSDNQLRDILAQSVKEGAQGTYGGQAAADVAQLRSLAERNGVELSDPTLRSWVQRMAAGESIDGFEQYVREMASSAFPQFADRLQAGADLADIADPYRQQMARVLELNPEEITLQDPTIRKALQTVDAEGKPMTKPLWAFERELKQDTRWRKTTNARDQLMDAGRQVLSDFGLA